MQIQLIGSTNSKFDLGRLAATSEVLQQVPQEQIQNALKRHHTGDWGEVDNDDKEANDTALLTGTRLLSVYTTPAGIKFWIITEADRSSTTILLPEEY
jgi:hypothetical protein